jgi:predicted  nucleic acid-binding Zn-ribbon protein
MHPDVVVLLELQEKDLTVTAVDEQLDTLKEEVAGLDRAIVDSESALDVARRAATDAIERRTELETKIEAYRTQQERRRQRLEITRPGKDAANLMAEFDLGRSVLAQEESEWVRLADSVAALEAQLAEGEAALEAEKAEQEPQRAELLAKEQSSLGERESAVKDRGVTAKTLGKEVLTKYSRLRGSRKTPVVVPISGPTCGACFTAVPLHRRIQIKTGAVLGGCEACGVILYTREEEEE